MTQAVLHSAQRELNFEITYLIARFGRRRALFAILMTYWHGKARPPDNLLVLCNHLSRDVGIPELQEPSPYLGPLKA